MIDSPLFFVCPVCTAEVLVMPLGDWAKAVTVAPNANHKNSVFFISVIFK